MGPGEGAGGGGKGLSMAWEAPASLRQGFKAVSCDSLSGGDNRGFLIFSFSSPMPYQNTGPAMGTFLCPPRPLCTQPLPGHPWPFQDPPPMEELWPFVGTADQAAPALGRPSEHLAQAWASGLVPQTCTHIHASTCGHTLTTHSCSCLLTHTHAHTRLAQPLPPTPLGSRHQDRPRSPAIHLDPSSVTTIHNLAARGVFPTEKGALPPVWGGACHLLSSPHNGHCHSLMVSLGPGPADSQREVFFRLQFGVPTGTAGPLAEVWGVS